MLTLEILALAFKYGTGSLPPNMLCARWKINVLPAKKNKIIDRFVLVSEKACRPRKYISI